MAAIRIIDDHLELANIGTNTHAQIDTHISAADDYIQRNGSLTLTADWDIGDGRKISADEIRARDGAGLKLYDDGGNGIFVEDGGQVGIGTTTPGAPLHTVATADDVNIVRFAGIKPAASVNAVMEHLGAYNLANQVRLEFRQYTSAQIRTTFEFQTGFSTITDATRTSFVNFATVNDGVFGTQMTLKGDRLGIGIEDPLAPLQVVGNSDDTYIGFITGSKAASSINFVMEHLGAYNLANQVRLEFRQYTSASRRTTFEFQTGFSTITDATRTSFVNFATVYAGSFGAKMTLKGNKLGIGTETPTELLDINSDVLRLRTAKTPATAGAAGNQGDVCWDASFIYVCTGTNSWKRGAIAAW